MIHGLLILVLMLGTFLFPSAVAVALDEPSAYGEEQAIAPSVVRQGDFAVQLAQSLNLSNVESEDEAVRALATLGIEPAGGWMADYPMTPEIVAELRDAVVAAATAVRLDMGLDAAMRAFTDLVADFGLPLPADLAPGYAGGGAPSVYGPNCNGSALDNYYGNYGTPLYSYCPPPPAFFYLYSWVPCNFRWHGQIFTGFFIQRHIDRIPPHARHVDRRRHFTDDHAVDMHDRDHEFHRRVSQETTPTPGGQARLPLPERQRVFPADDHRYAAAIGERRTVNAAHPPDRLTSTVHARSIEGGGAVRLVVPTTSRNQYAQPSTDRVRVFPQSHEVRRQASARATVTPVPAAAPVPAPSVAAPIERRSVSRETSGWGWSDNRAGTARAGGLGFR